MSKEIRQQARVWTNFNHFLAFGFGSGLSPYAPGTMGTIVAIPIYLLMASNLSEFSYMLLTLIFLFYGIWACQKVSNDLKVHDFSGIVWDEIVGYLIAMAFLPMAWDFVILGFILFRFFDIVKPWPIKWLDKQVDGGLGIMIDDVLAGIFTWICLMLIWHHWIMVPYFPI